jgi:hypothetical protein
MKKRISTGSWRAIGSIVAALAAINSPAQDSSKAPPLSASAATPTASQTASVQLSPGVADILKLSRAALGDDSLTAFVSNSDATYNLRASEILYLREQGVSDRVITAMLNKPKVTSAPAAPTTEWATPPQSSTANVATPPAYVQPPSVASAPPAPTYVQPPNVYVAAPAPAYSYYPDYGYAFPPLSLSFGFGNYGHGGYYGNGGYYGHGGYNGHGGYYGGGYYGGHH